MTIQTHGFTPRIGTLDRPSVDLGPDAACRAMAIGRTAERRVEEDLHAVIHRGGTDAAMNALRPRHDDARNLQERASDALRASLDDLFARGASEAEIAAYRARVASN